VPYVCLFLLGAAFVLIQCLVGGTRLLYSLPAYGLLALASLSTLTFLRRPNIFARLSSLLAMALCFTYLAIRALCSPIAYLARPDLFSILGCLMVYLLVACHLPKTAHRLTIVGVLLAIAGAEVFVGLVQFYRDGNFMPFDFQRGPAGYWASGMFISHNHFSGYLEMVGLMALSIALWAKTRAWVRVFMAYCAVVCYVGVVIAGSRGGYLSAFCSLVVFAVLSLYVAAHTGRDKAVLGSVLTAAALGVGALIAVQLMSQSAELNQKIQKIAMPDIRTPLWEAGWDQFHTKPSVGTGAGTHLYYGRLFRRPDVETDPVHTHNDYLELLAEYGVLGALLMLVFVAVHAAGGLSSVKWISDGMTLTHEHGNTDVALQIGALSGIMALLVHSLVDFNLHIPGNALVCAFLFAILANPGVEKPGTPEVKKRVAGGFRYAAPVLGVGLLGMGLFQTVQVWRAGLPLTARGTWTLAMVLPRFPGEYYAEEARVALRDGDFQKARELAAAGIRYETTNPNLYFYLGEANRGLALPMRRPGLRNLRRERFEEAENAYQAGLRQFPHDIQLLLRLGQCLDTEERFEEAEPFYLDAVKSDPNLSIVHVFYGAHLEKAGRASEAEAEFQRANELHHHNIEPLMLELRGH